MQPAALLLFRAFLVLGFDKLLSIDKICHCRFVVMWVGLTMNCQNISRSKSLPADIHPLLFFACQDPHSSTSGYVYIIGFVHNETVYFQART